MDCENNLYFKGNRFFFRFLRFLNILEPGITVLSISKLFMWVMLIIVLYTLIYTPDNLPVIIAATGGQILSLANYAYRRYLLYKTGKPVSGGEGN